MLESLLYLFIYVIVIGMVAWLLLYLIDEVFPSLPVPRKFLRLIVIVFVVIAIIYLLLGLVGGTPRLGRL